MLKASRLPRRKDSGGAGTETSTVPFPYQKAKGGSLPRIWVAPRSVSSRPKAMGRERFLQFLRSYNATFQRKNSVISPEK